MITATHTTQAKTNKQIQQNNHAVKIPRQNMNVAKEQKKPT